jgi:hypothetical protein
MGGWLLSPLFSLPRTLGVWHPEQRPITLAICAGGALNHPSNGLVAAIAANIAASGKSVWCSRLRPLGGVGGNGGDVLVISKTKKRERKREHNTNTTSTATNAANLA